MTSDEMRRYRVDTLKMNQKELSMKTTASTRMIQNYEQGVTNIPSWFILEMEKIKPNDKGNPMNYRDKKFLEKVDKDIIENYLNDGSKAIAKRHGEKVRFISNRAFLLKRKGVM